MDVTVYSPAYIKVSLMIIKYLFFLCPLQHTLLSTSKVPTFTQGKEIQCVLTSMPGYGMPSISVLLSLLPACCSVTLSTLCCTIFLQYVHMNPRQHSLACTPPVHSQYVPECSLYRWHHCLYLFCFLDSSIVNRVVISGEWQELSWSWTG